jgi:hypothetical protein
MYHSVVMKYEHLSNFSLKSNLTPLCVLSLIYRYVVGHLDAVGPGSSVGIATGYRLDSPGIDSRCGRDFLHLSRPALGSIQSSVQWVLGLSRG